MSDTTIPDTADKPLPAFTPVSSLSSLQKEVLRRTLEDGFVPFTGTTPLPPPEVTAAGVADLNKMFEHSLSDSEAEFAMAQHKAEMAAKPPAPVKNIRNAHMIIIEKLLSEPGITITKLASVTGYSRQWLHKLMSSDAFEAKLAEKQKAMIEPIILETIADRIKGLTSRTIEILEERMESDKVSVDTALNVLGLTTKVLGMGQEKKANGPTNNFIVHVPAQMVNAKDWASQHGGSGATALAEPIDITPSEEPASLAKHSNDASST